MSKRLAREQKDKKKRTLATARKNANTAATPQASQQNAHAISPLAPYSNAVQMRQQTIQQLQTQTGNNKTQRLLRQAPNAVQRRRPTQSFDFSDDPETIRVATYNLQGAGKTPYDVIQDHVSGVSTALNNMRTGQLGAINQFMTHMSFESSKEAKADVLGAVFKHVSTKLWETAVGKLPAVAGIPASEILGVVKAMTAELERAAKAQQSFKLASFITGLRNATASIYQEQTTNLQTNSRSSLERQFSAKEGIYEPGKTIVTGEKAQFLKDLEAKTRAMLTSVPKPIQYEEALLVEWVTNRQAGGEGLTDTGLFGSWEGNGKVQLKYDTQVNNGRHTYTFESAKLFTATKSGNAADMLNRVMSQQGKKVYEMGIPVQVMLRTEGMMPGGRSFYAYWVRSRNDYDPPNRGWGPADRAWNAMPWETLDAVKRVEGG